MLKFRGAIMAIALLLPVLSVYANEPADSKNSATSASASSAEPVSVRSDRDSRPIVIGFLGGYVRHDDSVHTTVQVAKSLRDAYPNAIHVATFENRRSDDAHNLIVNLLGAKSATR